jgi:hypothetical protein
MVDGGILPNTIKINANEIVDGYEEPVEYCLTSFLNIKDCFKLMQQQVEEHKVFKPCHYLQSPTANGFEFEELSTNNNLARQNVA